MDLQAHGPEREDIELLGRLESNEQKFALEGTDSAKGPCG